MNFLGDCMTILLAWTMRILWCDWGQRMVISLLNHITPLWQVNRAFPS